MQVECKLALNWTDQGGVKYIHMRTQKGQMKHVWQTENCQLKMICENQGYFEVKPTPM